VKIPVTEQIVRYSDQNIDFKDVENDSFENMSEMGNMSQMLNVLGNEL